MEEESPLAHLFKGLAALHSPRFGGFPTPQPVQDSFGSRVKGKDQSRMPKSNPNPLAMKQAQLDSDGDE